MNGPLTADQLAELRVELERQLARLERSMKVTEEAVRPVELDQTTVGRLARMDAIQNQSLSKGLKDREVARLSQIEAALARMQRGVYGACVECSRAIPFERLLVFPEAPECAACGQ